MEPQPTDDPRVLVNQLIQQQFEIISALQKKVIDGQDVDITPLHTHTSILKDLIEMRSALEPRYWGRPSDIDAIAKTTESKIREKLLGSEIK